MPYIDGVGDEVVCGAVIIASVAFIFKNALWGVSLSVGRQGINVIERLLYRLWNGVSSVFLGTTSETTRIPSEEQQGFRARMDSPPENEICSVCHDNFSLPCQANCSHWFCGECILRVWDHSSALQPCRCPICRRPINLLIPSQSVMMHLDEPEAASVYQRIGRYNRMFGGGRVGLSQRLRDTPLLLRRLSRELMDPERALPLVFRARIICFLALLAVYVCSPVDIIPEGIFGVVGLLDDFFIALLVFFHLASLYRSALFYRFSGNHH